jgi:hypothetical protein
MKIYNPNREERAFIYQEAQDLEGLVKNLGSLSVMVEEVATQAPKINRPTDYRVTFMVAPESFGMRVQAVDTNLFDATIAAKVETVRQLNALVNSMPRAQASDAPTPKIPVENLH